MVKNTGDGALASTILLGDPRGRFPGFEPLRVWFGGCHGHPGFEPLRVWFRSYHGHPGFEIYRPGQLLR